MFRFLSIWIYSTQYLYFWLAYQTQYGHKKRTFIGILSGPEFQLKKTLLIEPKEFKHLFILKYICQQFSLKCFSILRTKYMNLEHFHILAEEFLIYEWNNLYKIDNKTLNKKVYNFSTNAKQPIFDFNKSYHLYYK